MLKIHHVMISVSNLNHSRKFYESLGFEVVKEAAGSEKSMLWMKLGDMILEMFCFKSCESNASLGTQETIGVRHFSLCTDAIDKLWNELKAKGIDATEPRMSGSVGRKFFYIKDPDGIPIEILES